MSLSAAETVARLKDRELRLVFQSLLSAGILPEMLYESYVQPTEVMDVKVSNEPANVERTFDKTSFTLGRLVNLFRTFVSDMKRLGYLTGYTVSASTTYTLNLTTLTDNALAEFLCAVINDVQTNGHLTAHQYSITGKLAKYTLDCDSYTLNGLGRAVAAFVSQLGVSKDADGDIYQLLSEKDQTDGYVGLSGAPPSAGYIAKWDAAGVLASNLHDNGTRIKSSLADLYLGGDDLSLKRNAASEVAVYDPATPSALTYIAPTQIHIGSKTTDGVQLLKSGGDLYVRDGSGANNSGTVRAGNVHAQSSFDMGANDYGSADLSLARTAGGKVKLYDPSGVNTTPELQFGAGDVAWKRAAAGTLRLLDPSVSRYRSDFAANSSGLVVNAYDDTGATFLDTRFQTVKLVVLDAAGTGGKIQLSNDGNLELSHSAAGKLLLRDPSGGVTTPMLTFGTADVNGALIKKDGTGFQFRRGDDGAFSVVGANGYAMDGYQVLWADYGFLGRTAGHSIYLGSSSGLKFANGVDTALNPVDLDLTRSAAGKLLLRDPSGGVTTPMLLFGDSTSAGAAIKRVGHYVQLRRGDDSQGAPVKATSHFSSYTADGVWGAAAEPSIFEALNGVNGDVRIGYQDDGAGTYAPAVGFSFHSAIAAKMSTLPCIESRVALGTPESYSRFVMLGSGEMRWGTGSAGTDTGLKRAAVGVTRSTDGSTGFGQHEMSKARLYGAATGYKVTLDPGTPLADSTITVPNGVTTTMEVTANKDAANGYMGADANGRLTSTKLQVSATDKIVGRSTSGAGASEEIACVAGGRQLISVAAPSEGAVPWNNGSGEVIYKAHRRIVKDAAETCSSADGTGNHNSTGATMTADADLQCALASGKTYWFKIVVMTQLLATPDFKWDINYTSTSSAYREGAKQTLDDGTTDYATTGTIGTDTTMLVAGTTEALIEIHGYITTTGAGTLQFRWAQNTASAIFTIQVHDGSYMDVWEST